MISPDLLALVDEQAAALPTFTPLAAMDLRELALHQFKHREPLLLPWLNSQDLAMIFAGRGIGKTHLAMGISMAVATGGTFAKWSAPRPAKVLYLDGELPGAVLQTRLAMHLPDVEPAPGFLRLFTPDLLPEGVPLPDLSTLDGQYTINAMMEDDTELVVIDNLSAWCRTGRENEAESWHPIATWILQLRRRGLAVLLIHHAGKGGQQRGTSRTTTPSRVPCSFWSSPRPATWQAMTRKALSSSWVVTKPAPCGSAAPWRLRPLTGW